MLFLTVLYASFSLTVATSICNSKIYCEGKFFSYMIETESFLYKAMLYPESTILNNFEDLLRNTSNQPTYEDLIDFRDKHFIDEEADVMVLKDYYGSSSFVEKILMKSQIVGDVTRNLVSSWNDFVVSGTKERKLPKEQYSLISPYEFINTNTESNTECTYWDHYWIVNGLIASNMHSTARLLIENLLSMVKYYGMVPAANRVFYIGRSNPPLLTPMAYNYYMTTKRFYWLLENIESLDQELTFWIRYRSMKLYLNGKNYTMYRYNSNITRPRPEMYKLDTGFVEGLINKDKIYKELNTLTETGDGISARWIHRSSNTGSYDISYLKPSKIIPVDLNSFLYKGFVCLSKLYRIIGNEKKRKYWYRRSTKLLTTISAILWNDTDKMWYDFNLETKKHHRIFLISNLMPIWAQAFDAMDAADKIDTILGHLQNYSILNRLQVQIPISATRTGYIWDYPATTSKLEAMVMEALAKYLEFNSQDFFNTTMANMLRGITNKYLKIKKMIQQDNYANILHVDRSKSPVIGSYIKLVKDYFKILGEPPCDSLIYCQGELYRRVMDGNPHIYKAMLFEEETILNNFNKLLVRKNNSLSHDDLTQFVDEHFREESNDILVTQDFAMKYPTSIGNISKELLNGWNVYALKGTSGRKFPSHQYSLLSPYEFYNTNTKLEAECQYWDNYLIVNGLLASENYITAQRIIDNLVSMVKRFGMVPAANRIFYATRSNPPLLVPMAYNFYKATNKKSWLNRTIAFLEKELMFWVENRAVNVPVDETVYTLYRYYSKCTEPRPELYKLDIAFGEIVLNKKRLYQELNTLTETGWGLSKRWLFSTIDYGEDADDLRQIQPSRVIPVDLNAFLYKSFKCLSFLHKSIKNEDKHILWKREAKKLLDAMSVVLWHEDELTWYDYDFFLNTPRYTFFISNLMPIWAKAYNRQKSTDILDKSYKLLQENYPDFTLIEQMPESIMDLGFSIGNPTLIPKLHVFILEGFQESGYVKAKKYFGNMFAEWLNNKMYEWIEPAYGTEHIAIDQKIDENRLNPLVASYVKVMQYYFDEAKMWGKKYEISISSRASYISPSVISMLYYFIITII